MAQKSCRVKKENHFKPTLNKKKKKKLPNAVIALYNYFVNNES